MENIQLFQLDWTQNRFLLENLHLILVIRLQLLKKLDFSCMFSSYFIKEGRKRGNRCTFSI